MTATDTFTQPLCLLRTHFLHLHNTNKQVNYYPSAVAKKDRPAPKSDVTVSSETIPASTRTRTDYTKQQDEFRQPGERYRSFDEAR